MIVIVPICPKSPNGGTRTEHWAVKHKRESQEKFLTRMCLDSESRKIGAHPKCPAKITITLRYATHERADDNLAASMKSVRDTVAQWLLGGKMGERDEDPRLTWVYAQEKVKKKDVGTKIAIESA